MEDAASLYAWVGPNLAEPRLVAGIRELVDEIHVAHYEALAEETDGQASGNAGGTESESERGPTKATGTAGASPESAHPPPESAEAS